MTGESLTFQRTRLDLPEGFTARTRDIRGIDLVSTEAATRCGATSVRLEYVVREGPIPPPQSSISGYRCEEHTLIHHQEVAPTILARLTCTTRGEFEGRAPSLCGTIAASMTHGRESANERPAAAWSLRPALDRHDNPNAVEFFRPGDSMWSMAVSQRRWPLLPGVHAEVLVTDVHHSGDNTLIVAPLGESAASVVFEEYVTAIEPAREPHPGDLTPVDLLVTTKEELEPMRYAPRCSRWSFTEGRYRDSGRACPRR